MLLAAMIVVAACGGGDGADAPDGFHLTGTSRWWPISRGDASEPSDWLLPLPPLGVLGSHHYPDERAAGFLSPWITAGSVRATSGDSFAELGGFDLTLLGLSPFTSGAIGTGESVWSDTGVLVWSLPWHRDHPSELFSLARWSAAGSEHATKLVSLLGSPLFSIQRDVPSLAIEPELDRFPRGLVLGRGTGALADSARKAGEIAGTSERDAELRVTALGPMFRWTRRSSGSQLLLRPLFAWDSDRGLSLPWAALTLGGDHAGFPSGEALAHLFPIVSRGADPRYYDVLWPLGAVYADDRYTILDLKLCFNAQWHADRGASFGVLPWPFGAQPRDAFNPDFPQYHLRGHALSWWKLDGETHFSLIEPLLLRYHDRSVREARTARELDLGPWGLLYREREDPTSLTSSSLFAGLHSYEYRPAEHRGRFSLLPLGILLDVEIRPHRNEYRLVTIPFLNASLLHLRSGTDHGIEILPTPWLSLLEYRADENSTDFGIGPFRCLVDLEFGPDRWAWALTPLVRYERLGRSERLRLLFIDVHASGVFAEDPGAPSGER